MHQHVFVTKLLRFEIFVILTVFEMKLISACEKFFAKMAKTLIQR